MHLFIQSYQSLCAKSFETISIHKTKLHPLPSMEIDENTITGNIQIVEEMNTELKNCETARHHWHSTGTRSWRYTSHPLWRILGPKSRESCMAQYMPRANSNRLDVLAIIPGLQGFDHGFALREDSTLSAARIRGGIAGRQVCKCRSRARASRAQTCRREKGAGAGTG